MDRTAVKYPTRFRISWLAILLFVLAASNASTPAAGFDSPGEIRAEKVLLLTDLKGELPGLSRLLKDNGWMLDRMVPRQYLGSETFIDLSVYSTVIVYIHNPLHPVLEEALICYAEAGRKLLLLHHSIASAKLENPQWLKFLGVSICPEDQNHPWKVTAGVTHTMVNLAPGHFITTNGIAYQRESEFSFSRRPDLEGVFPAFSIGDTEIFHNQMLAEDDEKVILFGYRMEGGTPATRNTRGNLPEMEPTSGWYKPAGKGWVFYFQAGHHDKDFRNQVYGRVLLNCLEWQPQDSRYASSGDLEEPDYVTLDLSLNETRNCRLVNGKRITVQLKGLKHSFDPVRKAVRHSEVTVEIDGNEVVLGSGMYNLPRNVGGVQIDCPVTSAWIHNRNGEVFNPWALKKAARIRIWPANSSWIDKGSFLYPVEARWFSSDTQMTNDPCYVDRSDLKGDNDTTGSNIYYHYGLDTGGCEGETVIRSAVDGLVLSSAGETMEDYRKNTPVAPRYDVIYILDSRGWIYRHSHFDSINPEIKPGIRVKKGQELGLLGKEGGSGGWAHFHFDINRKQPSGEYGSEDGYAFYWQSYFEENPTLVKAVARPHRLTIPGREILLDGSKSVAFPGSDPPLEYEWILSDGTKSSGMVVITDYEEPGYYSEILRITDQSGNTDYDFCPVYVVDPEKPRADQPHTIHAAFHPTRRISPGEPVLFKVRSFGIDPLDGQEIWNFGDGSPPVRVRSDGNSDVHNPDGYANTTHSYGEPGCYLVSVSRTSRSGFTATTRLKVAVGENRNSAAR